MAKLSLDWDQISRCRELAEGIVHPVQKYVNMHSTISVERSVLRLLGFNDILEMENGYSFPLSNLMIDKMGKTKLRNGVASVLAGVRKKHSRMSQKVMGEKIARGDIDLSKYDELPPEKAAQALKPWIDSAYRHLDRMRYKKEEMRELGGVTKPLKYVMVGTGNIHEDVHQARSAARQGADVIAMVRSTAQSLLDYVPNGATQEGFGGSFATQENFRIMKEALDDVSHELGRYVQLAHHSSGLCMPEFAALAAFEGVDYLLNDAFYGPLYRDINVKRSLIDQFFAKIIVSRAGVAVHFGEDTQNFLGGEDNHFQELAMMFINEQFAKSAGMRDDLIGIGHAFEVDPESSDSLIYQLAISQLLRELFPRSPLKFFPSYKYKSGDPLMNQTLDTMFNIVGIMTGQRIQMLGVPAENFQGSQFGERYRSIESASQVFKAARSLYDEIAFVTNGKVMRRARTVLDMTYKYLHRIKNRGLFDSMQQGLFGDLSRSKDGGRGFDGIFAKSRKYYNPFSQNLNGNSR